MRRMRIAILGFAVICGSAIKSGADVKTEEKSLVKFEGMMGRVVGMFGGKAAREGTLSTVALKGNRKMTANESTGEIIDLDEEKVYHLDMRKKNYEVMTFAEMRRRMQEAQEEAAKAAKGESKAEAGQPTPKDPGQKEMEIDFSLKESGQKRAINGFDCREVVMTITAREKGKTLEQAGGIVMTSNIWLSPTVKSMKEIAEFDQRYMQKLGVPFGLGSAEQMALALAMYPAIKQVMGKFQSENVNMDGTAILTVMTLEAVKSPEQMTQEKKQESEGSDVTSIRGLGGLLGRKIARKKAEEEGPKNRVTVFTVNQELLKVSSSVAPTDLAIPAGFKEKK